KHAVRRMLIPVSLLGLAEARRSVCPLARDLPLRSRLALAKLLIALICFLVPVKLAQKRLPLLPLPLSLLQFNWRRRLPLFSMNTSIVGKKRQPWNHGKSSFRLVPLSLNFSRISSPE